MFGPVATHGHLASLKNKKGKTGACAIKLKLNMDKSYDRVEWRYLKTIMKNLDWLINTSGQNLSLC